MGEYAKRQDGEEVKIGTCGNMYYLRYEDRVKMTAIPCSLDPQTEERLFWRLPFPDEDDVGIGCYKDHKRGLRLYQRVGNDPFRTHRDFIAPACAASPGIMQLRNDAGLLLNVQCYHGEKLPDCGPDARASWNGKSWFYELASVKNVAGLLFPVVHCRFCGEAWRFTWEEVLPFVGNKEMKARLEAYALVGAELPL